MGVELLSLFTLLLLCGGYLNSKEITVEAVLTTAGRTKIANGESLGITRFALADDEVDYNLYKPEHPNGTEFAGDVILNMPLMEAFVDETQVMRYKLVSLPRDTSRMPVITTPAQEFVLDGSGVQAEINPSTKNGSNNTLGYTAIVHNADVVSIGVAQGGSINTTTGTIPAFLSDTDETRTQTAIGRRFVITSKPVSQTSNTKITLLGNETGGSILLNVKVQPDEALTS